jgi:hypothetical protein
MNPTRILGHASLVGFVGDAEEGRRLLATHLLR